MSEQQHIVINCPLCGERGLHVMGTMAADETRQCLSCGYVTAPKFKCEKLEDNVEYNNLTQEMKEWAKHEEGYIWIPTIMTLPFGLLYPFNDEDKNLKWGFAEMIDIPEDEQKDYPREDGKGYYTSRYDTDNANIYETFVEGMSYVNETVKSKTQNATTLSVDDEKTDLPEL